MCDWTVTANFDKFTKILLKNLCFWANYRNFVWKNLEKKEREAIKRFVQKMF